ncbi:MAG: hypothetical protein V7L09_17675, partial [Nostoc sp.]|uniref:hypothetical protein n=1 Tax=Nostoc sp. TaxID=1180 RepID=UPI002FF24774
NGITHRCMNNKTDFAGNISLDYLLNPKNPTPPKLRFVSPPRLRGGIKGWGAMTVEIISNYANMI